MKTKVVYIAGDAHSGSTLLDLILGSHSKIESVGEVTRRAGQILCGQIERRGEFGGLCTCGVEFSSCQFWAPIFERIRARDIQDETFLLNPSVAERDNEVFIAEVLRHSGKPIYLESTKSARRLKLLQQTGSIDLHVLQVVRDGRAVAYSNVLKGREMLPYARRWNATNLAFIDQQDAMPGRWLTVKYERFVSQPVEETKRIMGFVGEPFETDQMKFGARVHHNLAGNRMRWSGSSAIVADTKFLSGIDPLHWVVATATMYRALRKYGYPLSRAGAKALLSRNESAQR